MEGAQNGHRLKPFCVHNVCPFGRKQRDLQFELYSCLHQFIYMYWGGKVHSLLIPAPVTTQMTVSRSVCFNIKLRTTGDLGQETGWASYPGLDAIKKKGKWRPPLQK